MNISQAIEPSKTDFPSLFTYQPPVNTPLPEVSRGDKTKARDILAAIRILKALAAKGFTLATIGRLVRGELDGADEALIEAVTGGDGDGEAAEEFFDLDELAVRSGIPVALLQAIEREGLLVGRRHEGGPAYTPGDVGVARAGLRLLEPPRSAPLRDARPQP